MAERTRGAAVTVPTSSMGEEATDRVFEALADGGRRAAVGYLADGERAVSRDELVHHVAVETAGATDGGGCGHERLAARFHHHHLPKLEAAGLVDYDPEAAVVRGTALADRVAEWVAPR